MGVVLRVGAAVENQFYCVWEWRECRPLLFRVLVLHCSVTWKTVCSGALHRCSVQFAECVDVGTVVVARRRGLGIVKWGMVSAS